MKSRFLVLFLPLTLGACGYNRIQTLDEQASSSKQQIEVQLQRRADLVPNLVATVKGYAAHEEQVLTEVTNARAKVGQINVNAADAQSLAQCKAWLRAQLPKARRTR